MSPCFARQRRHSRLSRGRLRKRTFQRYSMMSARPRTWPETAHAAARLPQCPWSGQRAGDFSEDEAQRIVAVTPQAREGAPCVRLRQRVAEADQRARVAIAQQGREVIRDVAFAVTPDLMPQGLRVAPVPVP